MAKMFMMPAVFLTTLPVEPTPVVTGGGSGQGGVTPITDAVPCSYAYWLDHYANEDWDATGDGYDPYDFADWWTANNFTKEDWNELNPDLPWEDYFG